MAVAAGLRPIQCVQDSYGRWWYTPPTSGDQTVRASVGPFNDRGDAMHAIVTDYPGHAVVMDGVTVGAAKPPPLPRVNRAAERERAGLGPLRAPGQPPAAIAPKGVTVTTQGLEGRTEPVYGEPKGYGQGQRFEEQHGRNAGRLAEGLIASEAAVESVSSARGRDPQLAPPEPVPAEPNPLDAAQERARAMADAIAKARGE